MSKFVVKPLFKKSLQTHSAMKFSSSFAFGIVGGGGSCFSFAKSSLMFLEMVQIHKLCLTHDTSRYQTQHHVFSEIIQCLN